jgi:predicted nucleotidyltransferase
MLDFNFDRLYFEIFTGNGVKIRFLGVAMKENKLSREAILRELKNYLSRFERLYGVTKIGIFGSAARDELRPNSDIDVVVQMREPDLFYVVHIKETLENDFNRPVDVIRYRDSMNRYLKARIDREALYA